MYTRLLAVRQTTTRPYCTHGQYGWQVCHAWHRTVCCVQVCYRRIRRCHKVRPHVNDPAACTCFIFRQELREFGLHVALLEPTYYRTGIINAEHVDAARARVWQRLSDEKRAEYGDTYLADCACTGCF
jgi:hypothetical protein